MIVLSVGYMLVVLIVLIAFFLMIVIYLGHCSPLGKPKI